MSMIKFKTCFAIFTLLSFVSMSNATQMTSEMIQNLALVQLSTGYVVDDVLNFLNSFKRDIVAQLNDIDGGINTETTYLEEVIAKYKEELAQKKLECKQIKSNSKDVLLEYEKQKDLIAWITDRIVEDEDKIVEYTKQSCKNSLNFVEFLRNASNTLNFIKFLRSVVNKFSLDQMDSVALILKKFNHHPDLMTSSEIFHSMLLEFNSSTGEDLDEFDSGCSDTSKPNWKLKSEYGNDHYKQREIGTGHIDNNKEDLHLKPFQEQNNLKKQQLVEQLLVLLDDLEQKVQASINQRIDDQIAMSETTSDFILLLEVEISKLKKELPIQLEILSQLQDQSQSVEEVINACSKQEDKIYQRILDTYEKHDQYSNNRGSYQAMLLNQYDLICDIISLYDAKVYKITTVAAKQRYDDLIDNGIIDYSAHSDDRQLTFTYDSISSPELLEAKANEDSLSNEVHEEEQEEEDEKF